VGRSLTLPGFYQTRSYSCGYACALMVARYFEADVIGQELFARLGTGRDGTRQTAIVRELRAHGVRANVRYDVDFGRLRSSIDQGKLVIAYMHDIDHWVVCYGYTRDPDRVYLADPRPGESCEHPWADAGRSLRRFGIVCSPGPDAAFEPAASVATDERGPGQLSFDFGIP
jgi:ABC-type bacteriocin/lantibiotic exporter with double-glycine peptidase domain